MLGSSIQMAGKVLIAPVAKSAAYTAGGDETILVDATAAARTITLPAAAGKLGWIYNIKKVDSSANAVVIDGNASETIDGELTFSLTVQYMSLTIVSDGSNWHII